MKRSSVVLALVVVALIPAATGFVDGLQFAGLWLRGVAHCRGSPRDRQSRGRVYPFSRNSRNGRRGRREKLRHFSTAAPEVKLQALQQAFFDPGEFEFDYEQTRDSYRGGSLCRPSRQLHVLHIALCRDLAQPRYSDISGRRQTPARGSRGTPVWWSSIGTWLPVTGRPTRSLSTIST